MDKHTEKTTTVTTNEPVVHPANEPPAVFRETLKEVVKPDPPTTTVEHEETTTRTKE